MVCDIPNLVDLIGGDDHVPPEPVEGTDAVGLLAQCSFGNDRPRVDSNSTHSLGGFPDREWMRGQPFQELLIGQFLGSGSCAGLARVSRPIGVDRPAAATKWFAT
jgi:hypothetical protein